MRKKHFGMSYGDKKIHHDLNYKTSKKKRREYNLI
jgi:hypothetical protein